MPLRPARTLVHDSSTVNPVQLTVPIPVTTTRLIRSVMLLPRWVLLYIIRRWMIVPFDPLLAAGADLFLPHGPDLFQAIDAVTGGLKHALIAMAGRNGDEHGEFADAQAAHPLHDGDALHR